MFQPCREATENQYSTNLASCVSGNAFTFLTNVNSLNFSRSSKDLKIQALRHVHECRDCLNEQNPMTMPQATKNSKNSCDPNLCIFIDSWVYLGDSQDFRVMLLSSRDQTLEAPRHDRECTEWLNEHHTTTMSRDTKNWSAANHQDWNTHSLSQTWTVRQFVDAQSLT